MMIPRNINLAETLEITISSMFIVFLILILLAFIVSLFRFIPDIERLKQKHKKKRKQKYISFEDMDEDKRVAVLVATVVCKNNLQSDVVLKSVRKL